MAPAEMHDSTLDATLAALYAGHVADAAFVGALRRRLRAQVAPLHGAAVEAPFGTVYIAWRGRTICSAALAESCAAFATLVMERCGESPTPAPLPPALAGAIAEALLGRAPFRGAVAFPGLSPFQCAVLEVVRRIPPGQVRSYEWVARHVGHAAAVRAVGTALARNPVPFLVPCHRVVRADWDLGRYSGGATGLKARLLALEGVDVADLAMLRAHGMRLCGSATTRVFCLPTCVAQRRVQPEHVVRFGLAAEARAAGFRPCKLCRPA